MSLVGNVQWRDQQFATSPFHHHHHQQQQQQHYSQIRASASFGTSITLYLWPSLSNSSFIVPSSLHSMNRLGFSFSCFSITWPPHPNLAILRDTIVFSILTAAHHQALKWSGVRGCNQSEIASARERQSPTALQCYYMCVYVEMGVVLFYNNTAICREKWPRQVSSQNE